MNASAKPLLHSRLFKNKIMKTAIQLVAQNLLDIKTLNIDQVTEIVSILSMAMEKEKQDIIDSFNQGMNSVEYFLPNNKITEAEQYYKETYIDSNQAGI